MHVESVLQARANVFQFHSCNGSFGAQCHWHIKGYEGCSHSDIFVFLLPQGCRHLVRTSDRQRPTLARFFVTGRGTAGFGNRRDSDEGFSAVLSVKYRGISNLSDTSQVTRGPSQCTYWKCCQIQYSLRSICNHTPRIKYNRPDRLQYA